MKRMILVGIWIFLLYTVWILDADFNLFPNKDSDTYADRLANQAFFEEMSKPSKLGYVPNLDFAFVSVDHLMYNIKSSLCMVEKLSDFQEAEKLYVAACGDYQDRFNSIPAIRPFLGEFPLTPNDLAPSLSFRDVDGQRIPPPDIASVYLRHGVLAFTHVKSRSLETIYEKPVQAVEGLKELYQRGISRNKEGPKPHIPTYHYLWKGGDVFDELSIFGREFAQKNRLEPVCCILKKEKGENRPFQFGFRGTQQLSLSMARKPILKYLSVELFVQTTR
jgi:hypothetical protein